MASQIEMNYLKSRQAMKLMSEKFSVSLFVASLFITGASQAVEPILDIAQTPLELTPTVAPNVMILMDDSGSMDFEIMTADANSSGLFMAPNPDGSDLGSSSEELSIEHREGCELVTAAFGGYAYGAATSVNQYTPDSNLGSDKSKCYVADEESWRFRCSSFNTLYFDPTQNYQPWPGLRDDGTEFPNAVITEAPLDPYQVNSGSINLESPSIADTGISAFRYYNCRLDESTGDFVLEQEGPEPDGGFVINSSTPDDIKQNFANWFSYYRSRHLRAKGLLGNFVVNQQNTRIGITKVNPSSPSLRVAEMNASFEDASSNNDVSVSNAKRALLDVLYSSTPTQISSRFDVRYIQTARYLKCRNTSIFTGDDGCPSVESPAGTCQANHIVLASDGFIDDVVPLGTDSVPDEDSNNNSNFDGPPFNDDQTTFDLSDSYRTLSDIAMRFYERDLHNTNSPVNRENAVEPTEVDRIRYPSVATDPLESDEKLHQHIKTHVVLFDVPLLPDAQGLRQLRFPGTDPATEEFESLLWKNPYESNFGLLQSLYHAAFSGRGEAVSATDNESDIQGAQQLMNTVAQGVGSTTPVAISTQGTSSDLVIYRTFYDSSSNSGDLVAQEITIGTDGNLNIESNNQPDFKWSAAKQLDILVGEDGENISSRNVLTYSNVTGDGINFNLGDLDQSQKDQLKLPEPSSMDLSAERIDYLKGVTDLEGASFDAGQFRLRPEVTSTGGGVIHNAKLGTIANSAPVFVGKPQAVGRFGGAWPSDENKTYFDFQTDPDILARNPSILVGANDGMLHVFNANTGREVYAYIPSLVFDNLSALTLPEYKHRFFVDATPVVEDIYSSIDDQWKTIVVGGLGAGGRGYYALDITDRVLVSEPDDRVLWEFGPEDDPESYIDDDGKLISDLGLSFGEPIIAMSNAATSGEKKWVAIFGNGYNSTGEDAVVFIAFIDQGGDLNGWNGSNDVIKVNLGGGGGQNPNGVSDIRGIDRDGNGTVDYIYAGDLLGNLHVIDISTDSFSNWTNDQYVLYEAEYNSVKQPITTKPIAVNNEGGTAGSVLVIFATGSYFRNSDAINTEIQSLYAVEHTFDANDAPITQNELETQVLLNDQFVDPVSNETIDVRIFADSEETQSNINNRGWRIDFNVAPLNSNAGSEAEFPGEKAVRELQLRNDVLFVNTILPQPLSCDPSPGGFSLAINPQTGTAGEEPIFDINNDSEFNEQDSINLGADKGYKAVAGTRFDSTPSDSTFFGDYRITQLSDTNIDAVLTNTAKDELVGRQAWREVEF